MGFIMRTELQTASRKQLPHLLCVAFQRMDIQNQSRSGQAGQFHSTDPPFPRLEIIEMSITRFFSYEKPFDKKFFSNNFAAEVFIHRINDGFTDFSCCIQTLNHTIWTVVILMLRIDFSHISDFLVFGFFALFFFAKSAIIGFVK